MLFKIIPKTFKFTRLVFNIALIMFPIGIGLTLIGEKMEPAESSDNTSENTEISTEINEFDPFSEIDFTFSDTDDMGNEYIYPSKFRVTVSSKDKSLNVQFLLNYAKNLRLTITNAKLFFSN